MQELNSSIFIHQFKNDRTLGGLSVLIGALAAHSLRSILSPFALVLVETGARYQMYHALALFGVGLLLLLQKDSSLLLTIAGGCFIGGVLMFSGSLYGLSLGNSPWLGPVTPIGGLLLMAGWVMLAIAALKLN
jgi:uncharacterized membrane protein YgdD (TMEM256/DUF423 family)